MRVSVVIPTHNRADLLARAVHCALYQEGVDHEVVVVDDGSTDDTADVLTRVVDDRLTVLRHADAKGVSRARNAGIAAASGDWVAFLDDDDVWSPDKLARQVATATADGAAWVYAGMVTVDVDLTILHGNRPDDPETIAAELPVRDRIPSGPSNLVVRKAVLDEVGGFDPELSYDADWDLWLRILMTAGGPTLVEAPLLAHVRHPGNMDFSRHLRDLEVIERRYAGARGGRRLDHGITWRWMASSHLESGDVRAAVGALVRAFRHDPSGTARAVLDAVRDPRVSRRTAFRRAPDTVWREEAEAWLAPLRARWALTGSP